MSRSAAKISRRSSNLLDRVSAVGPNMNLLNVTFPRSISNSRPSSRHLAGSDRSDKISGWPTVEYACEWQDDFHIFSDYSAYACCYRSNQSRHKGECDTVLKEKLNLITSNFQYGHLV